MTLFTRTKVTAAAAAILVLAAPAAAAAGPSTPVGTWDGVVTVNQDPPHNAKFFFTSGGKACLTFGQSGDVHGSGSGKWWHTGEARFSYQITHTVYAPDNTFIGTVAVEQDAQQNTGLFTSSGKSTVYAPDGTPIGEGTTKVDATLVNPDEPTCQD